MNIQEYVRNLHPADIPSQVLVTWLRHVFVHPPSRQSELRPELIHQLITPSQPQNLNQRRHFGHYLKIGIYSVRIARYHILSERGTPCLAPSKLSWWDHGVVLVLQGSVARRHNPSSPSLVCPTLTVDRGENFAVLKMPQGLMGTTIEYGHLLASHTAKEISGYCGNISGHSHEKTAVIAWPSSPFCQLVWNTLSVRARSRQSHHRLCH